MKKDSKCASHALTHQQMCIIGKAICDEVAPLSWNRTEKEQTVPLPPSLSEQAY